MAQILVIIPSSILRITFMINLTSTFVPASITMIVTILITLTILTVIALTSIVNALLGSRACPKGNAP